MGQILLGFPSIPSHIQTVELGGVSFQIRFTFIERTGSWYMDLYAQDGTAIATGRRLATGWGPLLGLLPEQALPAGIMYVRGPEPYARLDLGDDLVLMRFDESELPSTTTDEDADIVIVVS